jgi:hypothetical protein
MTCLRDELAAMGATLSDDDFVSMILASMPDSFRMILSLVTQAGRAAGRPIASDDLI